MNHSKLLKLSKSLNKFSFDDLAIISELSEQEVQLFIDGALEQGAIKKIENEEYLFINRPCNSSPSLEINHIGPSKLNRIKPLLNVNNRKIDYEIFMHISKYQKEKTVKYLLLFKAIENVKNKKVKSFVLEWGEKYPQYKISYSTFLKKTKEYQEYGIIGLISEQMNYEKSMALISDKVFKQFKQLYLSQEEISADECFKIIKSEDKKIILPLNYIPFFLTKLRNELKDSAIAYYRAIPSDISKFMKIIDDEKKIKPRQLYKVKLENFDHAAKIFLETESKSISFQAYKSYKSIVKNHLTPFFSRMRLENITIEKLNDFIQSKINDGFSTNSINIHLNVLRSILSLYGNEEIVSDVIKKFKCIENEIILLDKSEIKIFLNSTQIHSPKFYAMLLMAITTGINLEELLALQWSDIDFKSNIIKIDKALYKKGVLHYKKSNLIRTVYIIPKLLEILISSQKKCPKNINNLLFPSNDGNYQNIETVKKYSFSSGIKKAGIKIIKFSNLRDIYASLLIKNNVPLSFIKEALGHSSLDFTVQRYKSLVDENKVEIDKIFETVFL